MDRTIIDTYLSEPGTCLRVLRTCGSGAYVASVIRRGDIVASGRGTSQDAALDALASELTTRAA
jgi:hypothetical protein